MGYVLAIMNAKGGVGKSTLTGNLGAGVAALGRRVLLVDCDPQSSLTNICGSLERALAEKKHLWAVLERVAEGKEGQLETAVLPTEHYCGAFLLAAAPALFAADVRLQATAVVGAESVLRRALQEVRDQYDLILLDCRPALGVLPTNVAVAADGVLVPFVPDAIGKEVLPLVFWNLSLVQKRLNPALQVVGVVINRFQPRQVIARTIAATLPTFLAEQPLQPLLLATWLPERAIVGRAAAEVRAVRTYTDAQAQQMARLFDQVAVEVLTKIGLLPPGREE